MVLLQNYMYIQKSPDQESSNDNFYAEIPVIYDFKDATNSNNFYEVPEDWVVVITDIEESTKAIEEGRYKDINFIGASSIIVLLNLVRDLDIPFVFGGDGASILLPAKFVAEAEQVLGAVQEIARYRFALSLRVGIIPVKMITANYDLKIAKLWISDNYSQAIIRGGGITYATNLVKDRATMGLYSPSKLATSKAGDCETVANFTGLECRWQDIPTRHEEILSLIIQATAPSQKQIDLIYYDVIDQIERIYGRDLEHHPVVPNNLRLSLRKKNLSAESKFFANSRYSLQRSLYMWKIRLINILGIILMRYGIKLGGFNWGGYKKIVAEATDFKKFDDVLRMVISGTLKQRRQLTRYLDKKFKDGRLIYGFHTSEHALMTCLVFERDGRQVHFVDGADGGYTLAAKEMKARMRS